MRPSVKVLKFPLAGVVKKHPFSKEYDPGFRTYGTPVALNVRGKCALDHRERGGSRPFLVTLDVEAGNENLNWYWPNGDSIPDSFIEWAKDQPMVYAAFETSEQTVDGGRLVRIDSLVEAVATKGLLPDDYTISAIYRDRLVLVKDDVWYMSRQGDYEDFDIGMHMEDVGRAVAGGLALSADSLETITAVIPIDDRYIYFATKNTLWVMNGDPTTGQLRKISDTIGVISPWAWTRAPGMVAFLSNNGVYLLSEGGLDQFSFEANPLMLRDTDVKDTNISMAYDVAENGFFLFITPDDGIGEHYYLDMKYRSTWPLSFVEELQPVATARLQTEALEVPAFLCRDGKWRRFYNRTLKGDKDEDDVYTSSVSIGPFKLSQEQLDGMIAEVYATLAEWSTGVVISISTGKSAEDAVQRVSTPAYTFSLDSGWNAVFRPRVRGAWCIVTLTAENSLWAYENISILQKQTGRLR